MKWYEISMNTLVYTALSFLIPFGIYKANQWMHQKGDPAWMKEEKQAKSSDLPNSSGN